MHVGVFHQLFTIVCFGHGFLKMVKKYLGHNPCLFYNSFSCILSGIYHIFHIFSEWEFCEIPGTILSTQINTTFDVLQRLQH